MLRRFIILACALMLQACGTSSYAPTEYPLRSGLIPRLDVAGNVKITNAQPSNDPVIVYSYMGRKLSSDLHAITETMTQQAIRELSKNGNIINNESAKIINIKVNSLLSEYVVMFWNSKLQFQATLGTGKVVDKTVAHTSGVLLQDLNGCIAESVMELFKDEKIRKYLAS